MCVDQNGMAWVDALMNKKDPPKGKMGFGYMLAGGSDASNTDPFATTPAPGGKWVDTGPHVMVFNIAGCVRRAIRRRRPTPKCRTSCSRERRTRT
jgi:hypothetical protein